MEVEVVVLRVMRVVSCKNELGQLTFLYLEIIQDIHSLMKSSASWFGLKSRLVRQLANLVRRMVTRLMDDNHHPIHHD